MAEFKDMLKYLREREGLSQSQFAKIIGVSSSTVSMYEVGKRQPDFETEEKIADYFNVSLNVLRGKGESTSTRIPILGRVAAGIPIAMIEETIGWEEIDAKTASRGKFFALKIAGDSMEPKISNGDIVIVRQQDDVESGEIAIVTIDGEDATCKRVRKYRDGIELIPTNPSYEPFYFSRKQAETLPVRIIGRVIELRSKF